MMTPELARPTGSRESLRIYDFHGLRLACSGDERVAGAVHSRLSHFAQTVGLPGDLRFAYRRASDGQLPDLAAVPGARPVYESAMGQVLYSDRSDRMFISSVWPIRAVCDPVGGQVDVTVGEPIEDHLWALSHPILTLPLIEALKRRGRFSLHASAVALGDKGLLFPGSSGSGKSTLCLALARAGFGYLGDDMLFLAEREGDLRAQAFPEAFDLTDETVRLFPELGDLLGAEKRRGWPKRELRVEERFGTEVVWECRPVALVFPRVARSGRSRLTPLDPGEALLELLPNVLLTEATSSQQHLEALARLAAGCACYRLETGTDFEDLAAELRRLLEGQP
jgi:hypothetical protein